MKIRIIVPQTGKWKIVIEKGRSKLFSRKGRLIAFLESKIDSALGTEARHRIHLIVDYDHLHVIDKRFRLNDRVSQTGCEWLNDIISSNKKELVTAAKVFLEDYRI